MKIRALGQEDRSGERSPYHTPLLTEFGEMRTLTLSPTFADDDESGPSTYTYNAGGGTNNDPAHQYDQSDAVG